MNFEGVAADCHEIKRLSVCPEEPLQAGLKVVGQVRGVGWLGGPFPGKGPADHPLSFSGVEFAKEEPGGKAQA